MSGARARVNDRTLSVGIDQRLVTINDIPVGQNLAICVDRKGIEVRVPLYYQRAKGALPQIGEIWLLSQDTGQWMFSVFIGGPGSFPAWTPLILGAGWSAVVGYHIASYSRTLSGDVQLTGRVTGSTASAIATLPAGFFSAGFSMAVPVSVSSSSQPLSSGQSPQLQLSTAGALTLAGFSAPSMVTVDLDAIFALSAG